MSSPSPNFYGYNPSLAMAFIGAILYAFVAGGTVFRFFQFQCWCFFIMVVAAIGEAVGFSARAYSVNHSKDANAFLVGELTVICVCSAPNIVRVADTCSIRLAPSFMAAACYIVFGRIVWMVTPAQKRNFVTLWVPPRFITPIFVLFDLLSFFIQFLGIAAVAGAIKSTTLAPDKKKDDIDAGIRVLKLGLIVQLLCFAVFVLIGGRFLLVSRRWPAKDAKNSSQWKKLALALNVSTTIIMLRAVFRVFEFSGSDPQNNYLSTHEWPFWLCDALPMLFILCIFVIIHPGQYLPKSFTSLRLNKRALAKTEMDSELVKVTAAPENAHLSLHSQQYPQQYPTQQPRYYSQQYPEQHAQALFKRQIHNQRQANATGTLTMLRNLRSRGK